jgi:hypothetical protein
MLNWFKRSGHATVVAYLALFLAVGGGAFAIAKSSKINGAKLKKRSVAGAKLKKHTITGTEVNLGKLGTVPSAKVSETATTAGVANSLATMTPLKLTRTTSSATGATEVAAAAAATPVTLYEDSHFRLYGKCFVETQIEPFDEEELEAIVYIATKQDGAIFDSDDEELSGEAPDGYLNVATSEPLREVINDGTEINDANMQYEGDTEFGATAADGYTIQGINQVAEKFGTPVAGNGPYGAGNVCLFSGYVLHS